MRNQTGGNITGFTLSNSTLSEDISWTGTLEDGRWIAIATGWQTSPAFNRHTIYKSTAGGADPTALSYTEAMDGYVAGADFPRLEPGVSNSCAVTFVGGGTSGAVQIDYYARFN